MRPAGCPSFIGIVLVVAVIGPVATEDYGRYEGSVKTEWLRDGRKMKLLEDFSYVDAGGKRWKAKKNAIIDGASISQVFWSTGGPYEDAYREASVIHDVFCDERPKTVTWQAVHRMFFDAMLASGVDRKRALVMYLAVVRFGPRWTDPKDKPRTVCINQNGAISCVTSPPPPPPPPPPTPTEEDVRRLEQLVESGAVSSPEDVEAMSAR